MLLIVLVAMPPPPRCATALPPLIHVLFVFSFPKDMVRIRVIFLLHTHNIHSLSSPPHS